MNYKEGKVPHKNDLTTEELTEKLLELVALAEENGLECEIELDKALKKMVK